MLLLALLIAAGAVAVVIGFSRAPAGSSARGRVWSEEHKHWHDQGAPARPAGEAGSAPPGTPPPGKVWSAEHGHWHDQSAPAGSSEPAMGTGPPPGAPPPGMVWSAEHGHWHKVGQPAGSASLPPVEVTLRPAPPR